MPSMSMRSALCAAAIALICPALDAAPAAAQAPPDLVNSQIEINYLAPTTGRFNAVADRLKQRRVLERLRVFLAPLKLPRKLAINVTECGAFTRPYKPGGNATICYELVEQIEKIAASAQPDARERVLVGAFIQAAFHEVSYAVFDILQVPVWGRAADAADRMSAFVMVQFSEDVALQTIIGTTAFGGPPKSFDFLVNPVKEGEEPLLPKDRAERCQSEYEQVRMAFDLRIMPYIDPDILGKVRAVQWLRPDENR